MRPLNVIILCVLYFLFVETAKAQEIARTDLIDDARQMLDIVETCHPDPYINAGGKIELYSSFYSMLEKIPEDGMELNDYWWLLSGFLSNIADGHTYLFPIEQPDYSNPGGIPIRFMALADSTLVIERVALPEYKIYIGCRVMRINGSSIEDLLARLGGLYPMENTFDHFRNLDVYLWYSSYMERLFTDWTKGDNIVMEVLNKKGRPEKFDVPTGDNVKYKTTGISGQNITLPDTKRCDFAFDWLDKEKKIAYINIAKQDEFREYGEEAVSGLDNMDPGTREAYRGQYIQYAHTWYKRYQEKEGPDSLELLISGLPSFTEFMTDASARLKEEKATDLIIDLRNNQGGVSLLSDILIYFLYGKEKLSEISNDNYIITYLSEPAVRIVPSFNIAELNKTEEHGRTFEIQAGDYDFTSKKEWEEGKEDTGVVFPAEKYAGTRTFYKEYLSGEHSAYYTPKNIYVLGSHKTFSAGYETLVRLIKGGAIFAGVPPAQPGNCFGMGISPVQGLKNSKIRLNVAVRRVVTFPDDISKGLQLNPEIPLTYKEYKKYGYDKNSTIHLVLDRIRK